MTAFNNIMLGRNRKAKEITQDKIISDNQELRVNIYKTLNSIGLIFIPLWWQVQKVACLLKSSGLSSSGNKLIIIKKSKNRVEIARAFSDLDRFDTQRNQMFL